MQFTQRAGSLKKTTPIYAFVYCQRDQFNSQEKKMARNYLEQLLRNNN